MEEFTKFEINCSHFAKVIRKMESNLIYAASKPDFNKQTLNNKYELLKSLTEIYNLFQAEYQTLSLVEPLASRVQSLMDKDPSVGIIIIHYQVRPNNTNFGHINYSPYKLC